MLAPLGANPGPYVERSPTTHARRLRVPVLVHAATNDEDVRIAEPRLLRDSIGRRGE